MKKILGKKELLLQFAIENYKIAKQKNISNEILSQLQSILEKLTPPFAPTLTCALAITTTEAIKALNINFFMIFFNIQRFKRLGYCPY